MKLQFVVNPISGGIDKEPFLKSASAFCEKYGVDYNIFKTTGKNDEVNLKRQLDDYRPDKVASVGGDGTTLFTAINLMDTPYPMGIIPQGSANGMAAELFVPKSAMQALQDMVLSEITAGLDLVLVNNEYYTLHIGDVGINAQIVNSYEQDPKRGMATYAKYFIEELKRLNPFEMEIKIDGEAHDKKGLMVAICNARKYGTGVPLNLSGNPMDGKFEVVVVENIDMNSLIKAGLSNFDEGFFDNQSSSSFSGSEAEISFKESRLLQLDGEVIGNYDRISAKMIAGAVKLITNKSNKYIQ